MKHKLLMGDLPFRNSLDYANGNFTDGYLSILLKNEAQASTKL